MFKFRKAKGHHFSAERQKLQKELFGFEKTVQHGFPHKPSALAFDPQLKLMAIGTKNGIVKIFGQAGVEFYCEHEKEVAVLDLFFLPNEGRIISLCDDNTLYLFEINEKDGKTKLENVTSCSLEGRLKKITKCCLHGEHLLIGTEGGNIYMLDVKKFSLTDQIIYQDVVKQNIPEDYKVNPGPVESILIHPTDKNKILIGFARGLMVLWDNDALQADQTYIGSQQLESASWNRDGKKFMSAHNDGTYIVWSTEDPTKQEDATKAPYGPFPCKAISKLLWQTSKNGDFVIYSGGLPRASFGDRNAITITQGDKHQVLDFTSKVIDFLTVSENDDEAEFEEPHALVVLAEEELVVLDLETEGWPVFRMPYLVSLHSSAIICTHHASNVPSELYDKLVEVGKSQNREIYSEREWPITGGQNLKNESSNARDLLLTGHEDGTVSFWDASCTELTPLYKLKTAEFFISGEEIHEEHRDESPEEWPPFRKVGVFDPFSDDPRMAVKKMDLDAQKGTLVVAGTAGQIVVFNFNNEEVEKELEPVNVNIVEDRDGFVWKGHEALGVKTGSVKMPAGFQPASIIQFSPPAAITALSAHAEWNLVASGTAHGLCLVDYLQNKLIMSKCTLNPNDLTGAAADTSISRRKSFKKSLRESFRRLRKGRSQRGKTNKASSPTRSAENEQSDKSGASAAEKTKETPVSDGDSPSSPDSVEVISSKPVERQIEARISDDGLGSIVRCLAFTQCYIINSAGTNPTLWVGTNAGTILIYLIKLPDIDKRENEPVTSQLAKEIQLKHRAPVIDIKVFEINKVFRVLISSEEQFKVFTLPQLKPFGKYKVTAHEGSMNRRIGLATFVSSSSEKEYSEKCVTCLNNQGQLSVFSIPDLKRQIQFECIRKEDINDSSSLVHQDHFSGITSLVFSVDGQGFYLHSPCEFQRFSLSAKTIVKPECKVELPEGARPVPEPEPEAEPEVEQANIEESAETATAEEVAEVQNAVALEAKKVEENEEEKAMEDSQETEKPKENDVSNTTLSDSKDDDSKLDSIGDITIDSVKDHLGQMTVSSNEESTVTITKSADSTEITKTEIKTEEKVVTMTQTIVVNSEDGLNRQPGSSATTNGHANSSSLPSDNTAQNEVKKVPMAYIDEMEVNHTDF